MGSAILMVSFVTSLWPASWPTSSQLSSRPATKATAAVFDLQTFLPAPPFSLSSQIANGLTAEAILMKELSGRVLFDRRANESRPIASLTKLMTASVAMEQYPATSLLSITSAVVATEGETGEFIVDERFPRNTLIKAALISSSNDASAALANKLGPSIFIQAMNEVAKKLEMRQTVFTDPTGLESTNRSSLNDLSLLVAYINHNQPEILEWSVKDSLVINGKTRRHLINLDYLLPQYREIIRGSKTGSTAAAGECLILLLQWKNSPPVFLGLLNSQDRFADTEKLIRALEGFYNQ